MKRLLAVAALGLLSCQGPPFPYSFAIDRAMPRPELDLALDAMAAWNGRTRPEYFLDIAGSNWRMYYAAPGADCDFGDGCERDRHRQAVWIKPGLGPGTYGVVLHELGHALGLEHTCATPGQNSAPGAPACTEVSRGVMDAKHLAPEFTETDLAECRRVGACP